MYLETEKEPREISKRIAILQQDSSDVAEVIGGISSIVQRIHELQNSIAVAVEEQTQTTSEIDQSAERAAVGSREIAERLTETAERAKATFANADSTEDAALGLAELAVELGRLVARFRYKQDVDWSRRQPPPPRSPPATRISRDRDPARRRVSLSNPPIRSVPRRLRNGRSSEPSI